MPTLLYKDTTLVKGVSFDSSRRVGTAMQAVKVYNYREVDELVFLDISATKDKRLPDFSLIDDLADECFMPLAVGGGIRSIEDVHQLLKVGADRVVVNSATVDVPGLISDIANTFGSQSVVVSIDARKTSPGNYEAYVESGSRPTGHTPIELARQAENTGAGEILICSIDRDGTMDGYDIDLIKNIASSVSIPVIASGGAGNYKHMKDALDAGASALAAASIFHFTEQTPLEAKDYLQSLGIPTRRSFK
ncbi:imidazole glycerol phosphate synthase subunit HisF [Magnetovibrio blakemorei]|nr:imidazole glycerol phosphate synthase cyclase subunit [Magnetovibrio blakemorei]